MRITKVTTKKGDSGKTELGDGTEVSKADLNIRVIGKVDELNSFIGFTKVASNNNNIRNKLSNIQNQLLNLGGELSIPNKNLDLINDEIINSLETEIEQFNSELTPLKEFVIPGEDEFSARLHVARSICRETETIVTEFVDSKVGKQIWIKFLNRLSDYLFVLSRYHVKKIGITEKQWTRKK
jgi:cob(I)alamin adenosyltransferase